MRGKTMRKFVRASILALALSCFTYAGNMPIDYTPPPPPPPSDGIIHGDSTESTGGIMQNDRTAPSDGIIQTDWMATGLTETLNVLGSVLSLF
jgi:hypothetical protein